MFKRLREKAQLQSLQRDLERAKAEGEDTSRVFLARAERGGFWTPQHTIDASIEASRRRDAIVSAEMGETHDNHRSDGTFTAVQLAGRNMVPLNAATV